MATLQKERIKLIEAVSFTLVVLVVLWGVHIYNRSIGFGLNAYGMHPKSLDGFYGIFTMPFLHSGSDWTHILNNSSAVLILLSTMIYVYREVALRVVLLSWLLTGVLTLLFGKFGSTHIGISGLTYAWVAFIFLSGLLRKDRQLIGVSLAMTVLYGSLVWGIFPIQKNMSWEGHLAGAISGLLLAVYFRKHPPYKKEIVVQEIPDEYEGEEYWREDYVPPHLRVEPENEPIYSNSSISKDGISIIYEVKKKQED